MNETDTFSSCSESSYITGTSFHDSSEVEKSVLKDPSKEELRFERSSENRNDNGLFLNETNLDSSFLPSDSSESISEESDVVEHNEMYLNSSEMSTFAPDRSEQLDNARMDRLDLDSNDSEEIFPAARLLAGADTNSNIESQTGSANSECNADVERCNDADCVKEHKFVRKSSRKSLSYRKSTLNDETKKVPPGFVDYDLGRPIQRKQGMTSSRTQQTIERQGVYDGEKEPVSKRSSHPPTKKQNFSDSDSDYQKEFADFGVDHRRNIQADTDLKHNNQRKSGVRLTKTQNVYSNVRRDDEPSLADLADTITESRTLRSRSPMRLRSTNIEPIRKLSRRVMSKDRFESNSKDMGTDYVIVTLSVDQIRAMYEKIANYEGSANIQVVLRKNQVMDAALIVNEPSRAPLVSGESRPPTPPVRKPNLAGVATCSSRHCKEVAHEDD